MNTNNAVDFRITSRTAGSPVTPKVRVMSHRNHKTGRLTRWRTLKYDGLIMLDRKTGAWAYIEPQTGSAPRITSPNWASYMEMMAPDFLPVTPEWSRKIQLRARGLN